MTLWYAGIFTLSSLLAFFAIYYQITSIVAERTDEELVENVEEFSTLLASQGLAAVERTMVDEARDDGEGKIFFRLLTLDGKELSASNLSSWGNVQIDRKAVDAIIHGEKPMLQTVAVGGRRHDARIIYGRLGPEHILQVGWSLEDDDEFAEPFREILFVTLGGVMILAALAGWLMAKRALAGVAEVTRTAREISVGELSRRVSVKSKAHEIERLATTFNDMLDRIEKLVTEMREMNDNIAHDLRSPITRIRGIAEMTLTTGKSIDEYESAAANTIEQCDRLLEMINTMLYIAEAEAGAGKLKAEPIDMEKVVRDACEIFQPMAEEKGVKLIAEFDGGLKIQGDRQAMQRMVANLVDNAINYTAPPGTVTVSVNGDEELGVISVTDTGIGISAEDLPHIFKRFYRCDRSRSKFGNGLGLSLVKAIVHCHNGHIAVKSAPDAGTTFTVTLPRSGVPS